MSGRFAAWLRVKPSPTTLAESSAIFRHVKSKGRVTTFIKAPRRDSDNGSLTTSFYTVFAHEPPGLHPGTPFDVPVYHNVSSPRDEDPFNIRGLQDRKPWPSPMSFSCKFEKIDETEQLSMQKSLEKDTVLRGHFKVKDGADDWLQEVMHETGAPAGIVKGLGQLAEESEAGKEQNSLRSEIAGAVNSISPNQGRGDHRSRSSLRTQKRRLKMNSLIQKAESD